LASSDGVLCPFHFSMVTMGIDLEPDRLTHWFTGHSQPA